MVQTYQSLNPLAQVSKPSWGLSGKFIIVPDVGDFYIGTVIEQLLICKGKKRNRQYSKYQDEWTLEKHLALSDIQTSREWMSCHLYPTHSKTASKSQEPKSKHSIQLGDLIQVFPAVAFAASQQHLGLTQDHNLHLAAQLSSFLACPLNTKLWQEAASDQG